MAKLKVEIVTPEKRVLSVQADEAIVPGARGLFGVRPGHTPFLSLMEPGWMTLKDGATTQRFYVAGGFVEVASDQVRVLADQAETEAEVDVEAARRRLSEAQDKLKGMSPDDARFEVEAATVRRETARITGFGRR
ncbi:MAG TPA: F0F1 ATP synthase subunit epsilon [Myxococcales bacterium]|jgi:F-type H+-transporting ATPase subunit epsilon|nr:F0F1 ATP synthase subunit epsilon [Myxococcales bacterium]